MNERGAETSETERIRARLVEVALTAYEDAGIQGLCESGRWEAAVAAMRRADLTIGPAPPGPPPI